MQRYLPKTVLVLQEVEEGAGINKPLQKNTRDIKDTPSPRITKEE